MCVPDALIPCVCAACGVPAGHVPIFEVVGMDGASVMDACTACGHPLDEGRAVLWWTESSTGLLASAVAPDDDLATLFAWWRAEGP